MSFQNCDLIQKTRYISAFVVKFFFLLLEFCLFTFTRFDDLFTLRTSIYFVGVISA